MILYKLRNICWKLQKAAPQSCCGPPPPGQIYGWATRLTRLIGGPPSQTRENNVNAYWQPSASTTAWGEDTSHQEDEPMNSGETGERGGCLHLSKYDQYFVQIRCKVGVCKHKSNEEHSKFLHVIKAFTPAASEGNDTAAKTTAGIRAVKYYLIVSRINCRPP